LAAAMGKINSTVKGVQLGVCTYSFRSLPRTGTDDVDTVIQAMTDCRAGQCELFSPQLEPGGSLSERMSQEERNKHREAVRQWRLTAPVEHFKDIRKRFDTAGIDIYAYTLNFDKSYTDEELEKCFEQTKAMGVKTIASSTKVSMLPRLQPLAEKHKIYVAVHGHSDTKHPDEFSSPETFQKALDMSDWFRVNLDIGHFSAAGFDPVAYIKEHHDRITHLHIKDRKKDDGPNEPFGEGNTPIKQVLQLLSDKKYAIPAFVEYEYKGTGTPVEEVNKCLAYMKNALA
ncbi:MAG: sugar phosphate isomerase/epimerase, partial [Acidobacteriaceae bacterium]|nr:sugar phosphate isomerase/epimerase [Acidobacteriaceae bacterium]